MKYRIFFFPLKMIKIAIIHARRGRIIELGFYFFNCREKESNVPLRSWIGPNRVMCL